MSDFTKNYQSPIVEDNPSEVGDHSSTSSNASGEQPSKVLVHVAPPRRAAPRSFSDSGYSSRSDRTTASNAGRAVKERVPTAHISYDGQSRRSYPPWPARPIVPPLATMYTNYPYQQQQQQPGPPPGPTPVPIACYVSTRPEPYVSHPPQQAVSHVALLGSPAVYGPAYPPHGQPQLQVVPINTFSTPGPAILSTLTNPQMSPAQTMAPQQYIGPMSQGPYFPSLPAGAYVQGAYQQQPMAPLQLQQQHQHQHQPQLTFPPQSPHWSALGSSQSPVPLPRDERKKWPLQSNGWPEEPYQCQIYQIWPSPHSRDNPPRLMHLQLAPKHPHQSNTWPRGYHFDTFDYVFVEAPDRRGFQWNRYRIDRFGYWHSMDDAHGTPPDDKPHRPRSVRSERRHSHLGAPAAARRSRSDSISAARADEELVKRSKEKRDAAQAHQDRSQRDDAAYVSDTDEGEDYDEVSNLTDNFKSHSLNPVEEYPAHHRSDREHRSKTGSSTSDRKDRDYVSNRAARSDTRPRSSRADSDRRVH